MDTSYLSLEGKVALITGACRGIGKAIALLFADAGAHLAISCRNQPHLDELAGEIRGLGKKALPVAAHVRKPEELKNMFEKVKEEFGRVDILVNNAATNPGMGFLVDIDEKMYDQIINTNLRGYVQLSQMVGKLMMEKGGGNIVNISSAGGVNPGMGLGMYCVSKAAINMLTMAMAKELGSYGIRVNAIAPSIVKTKFSQALWGNETLFAEETGRIPLKRIAQPEEVARTALYLASDASSYVTGQTILMDGGRSL